MFFSESADLGYSTLNIPASNIGLTPDMDGIRMIQETATEEWFNLREKMMRCEHKSIVNEDALLLEAGAGDFFKKIAEWFKKLIAYIKELIQKFIAFIDSKIKKDADFVKKYEKVVMNKDITKFEYNGYEWKYGENMASEVVSEIESLTNKVIKTVEVVEKATKNDLDSVKKDTEDGIENFLMGGKDSSDYKKEVFSTFVSSSDFEKDTLGVSYIKISEMLDTIKNKNKNIKTVEKLKTTAEKFFNKMASDFDKISTKLTGNKNDEKPLGAGKTETIKTKDDEGTVAYKDTDERNIKREYASLSASIARASGNIVNTTLGYCIEAIKMRNSEFRSIIAAVVSYNAKKNESYNFFEESTGVLDQF